MLNVTARFRALLLRRSKQHRLIGRNARAYLPVALASRLAHANWGVVCLLLAASLVVAGIFLPAASNLLGVGAALTLATFE